MLGIEERDLQVGLFVLESRQLLSRPIRKPGSYDFILTLTLYIL